MGDRIESVETVLRAGPHNPGAIHEHRGHGIVTEALGVAREMAVHRELAARRIESTQSGSAAKPEKPVAIFEDVVEELLDVFRDALV